MNQNVNYPSKSSEKVSNQDSHWNKQLYNWPTVYFTARLRGAPVKAPFLGPPAPPPLTNLWADCESHAAGISSV